MRDTEQAGTLISGVGERGATNISGLDFTIDDRESLEAEARAEAIAKAREQAETLAQDLGVRIVKLTGFYENAPSQNFNRGFFAAEESMDMAVPSIPMGEDMTTITVSVTYEVR